MLVYRAHRSEDAGKGPFGWLQDTNRDLGRHYGRLPCPQQENDFHEPGWHWHCAAHSFDNLVEWFPLTARRALAKRSYRITAFDVPEDRCLILEKQAMIHLASAKPLYQLDPVKLVPIVTLS